jgi:hypothetical protein
MTPAGSYAHRIEGIVRRYRSRVRAVLFVRAVLVTTTTTTAAVSAWNLLSNSTVESAATGLAVAAGAGLIASALFALHGTPTLQDTAAVIDDRLDTRNHVAAALQLLRDESPMAVLVVRGALLKLTSTTPAAVVPMHITKHIAAAALCVTIALLTFARAQAPLPQQVDGAAHGDTREPGPDTGIANDDTRADVSARRVATMASQSPSTQGRDPGTSRKSATASEERVAGPADASHRDPTTSNSNEMAREAAVSKRDPSPPFERSGRGQGSGTPDDDDVTLDSVAMAGNAAGPPSTAGTGTGRSLATVEGGASQAGGVSLGELTEANTGSSALTRQRMASTVATARTQAVTALTNDDIPPGLRRYVRDYFLRLQASGGRR